MATIIDLDFYRKFKIILPVRSRGASKETHQKTLRPLTKQYRRNRKNDLLSKTKE